MSGSTRMCFVMLRYVDALPNSYLAPFFHVVVPRARLLDAFNRAGIHFVC